MSENISPISPAGSARDWETLFECALLELDPVAREQTLENVKVAIMDRLLRYCFRPGERSLLAALNTISELQRVVEKR